MLYELPHLQKRIDCKVVKGSGDVHSAQNKDIRLIERRQYCHNIYYITLGYIEIIRGGMQRRKVNFKDSDELCRPFEQKDARAPT